MEISRPSYPTCDEAHILCDMGEEQWGKSGRKIHLDPQNKHNSEWLQMKTTLSILLRCHINIYGDKQIYNPFSSLPQRDFCSKIEIDHRFGKTVKELFQNFQSPLRLLKT